MLVNRKVKMLPNDFNTSPNMLLPPVNKTLGRHKSRITLSMLRHIFSGYRIDVLEACKPSVVGVIAHLIQKGFK